MSSIKNWIKKNKTELAMWTFILSYYSIQSLFVWNYNYWSKLSTSMVLHVRLFITLWTPNVWKWNIGIKYSLESLHAHISSVHQQIASLIKIFWSEKYKWRYSYIKMNSWPYICQAECKGQHKDLIKEFILEANSQYALIWQDDRYETTKLKLVLRRLW